MVIVRNFSVPIAEAAARERITAFFTRSGYVLVSGDSAPLRFKRGSLFGTYSNFNPLSWAAEASVGVTPEVGQSEITVELHITSDPFEKRFASELASAELSMLENSVIKNETAAFDVAELRKRIAANVYRTVGLLAGIIISVFLGAIAGMLLYSVMALSPAASAASGTGIFLVLVAICLVVFRISLKTHNS